MSDKFIAHITQYADLDQEEVSYIQSLVPVRTYKKGDVIFSEGAISDTIYFVLKGCVRLYYNVGGPELFTQNEIAQLVLQALDKPIKIIHLPDWIRRLTIWLARKFTSSKTYGPIEFFLSAMAMDMIAPKYGHHQLGHYFRKQCEKIVT